MATPALKTVLLVLLLALGGCEGRTTTLLCSVQGEAFVIEGKPSWSHVYRVPAADASCAALKK